MKSRHTLLKIVLAGIFLALGKLVVAPPAYKSYAVPDFPVSIEVETQKQIWRKVSNQKNVLFSQAGGVTGSDATGSNSLSTEPIAHLEKDAKYHQVLAYQEYQSIKESASPIKISLSYVVRTQGNWHDFIRLNSLISPTSPESKLDRKTPNGYYRLWEQGSQTHLYSCVNIQGSSVITDDQFWQSVSYRHSLTASRLAVWLMRGDPIINDSCLWIHLLTSEKYASLSEASDKLEPIWATIVDTWGK